MKLSNGPFKLNVIQDFGKGLIMAVGGAAFTIISNSWAAGVFTFNWYNIYHMSIGAGLVYIGGKFFAPTPKTVQIDPTKTNVLDVNTKEIIA